MANDHHTALGGVREFINGRSLAARGRPTYLIPAFPGVHEVFLNLNHFPGPANRDMALRRFLKTPRLKYKSDYYPRYLISRTLRQNSSQLYSQTSMLYIHGLSVNRIWTRPRVLLVIGPNGKCHQTAMRESSPSPFADYNCYWLVGW